MNSEDVNDTNSVHEVCLCIVIAYFDITLLNPFYLYPIIFCYRYQLLQVNQKNRKQIVDGELSTFNIFSLNLKKYQITALLIVELVI